MTGFENLSNYEMTLLEAAPAHIAVLIGAADDHFDNEEKAWAENILHIRTYSSSGSLQDFYKIVDTHFVEKMEAILASMPKELEARNTLISNELEKLNPILAKLDNLFAAKLYRSFKTLAAEVARASGGFLRIGAVSAAERPWVDLPMLQPIESAALNAELDAENQKNDAEKQGDFWLK